MFIKKIGLAAALAAMFITGNAAVAYAESDAGLHEAAAQFNTSAGMEADTHTGTYAPWSSGYAGGSYAYAPRHAGKTHMSAKAKMKQKHS